MKPDPSGPIRSSNSRALLLALGLLASWPVAASLGQTPEASPSPAKPPAGNSLMDIVNGSSIPSIALKIVGLGEHADFPQGSRIAGGSFPMTEWKLQARPKGPESHDKTVDVSIRTPPDSSNTAVVIGDFELIKSGTDPKPKLRASILVLPNDFSGDQKPHRITVVNGIPDKTIDVRVNELKTEQVESMAYRSWSGLDSKIHTTVTVDGTKLNIPMLLTPPIASVVAVIYLKDGKPAVVGCPQTSLKTRFKADE